MSEPTTAVSPATQAVNKQLGFSFVSIKELDPEMKAVLKDTVAKDTNDSELTYFLNVALSQDLDPFRKEVWCIKYDGKLTIQTGRDGFLKIAKRDPMFDSIQSAEVREGDVFTMDPISGDIEHRIVGKRGAILGAYAVIIRKDGKRLAKYVSISEYRGGSPIWKKYESAMICKCAEAVLCRQFANVTGISAEEAMPDDRITSTGSPVVHAEVLSLKEELLRGIAACKNLVEFNEFKKKVAGDAGRLFEKERTEVYAAARRKLAEFNGANVVDAEIVDKDTEMPIAMPDEEFQSWIDGVMAQETLQGVQDVITAVHGATMSPEQREAFTEVSANALASLTPKK
jgi:hypothetical protein